ncbi:MAG: acyl carrier protein [Terracidiphilus sp.]|jgi:acyl carrier protein
MDEHELRKAVAEILEVAPEDLKEENELDSFESYDSTARLSLLVCLSDFIGKPLEPTALDQIRTYGDILTLVKGSSTNGRSS